MTNREMLLFLSSCARCTRNQVRRLLAACPSLSDLTMLSERDREAVLSKRKKNDRLRTLFHDPAQLKEKIQEEAECLRSRRIRFLTPDSPDWPIRLCHMGDAPLWLFLKGNLPPADSASVSVIGSRDASPYGLRMADWIAGSLAESGVTVVSGMASGIDAAAQRAALKKGGKSLAILGSGINICYPKENFDLFDALIHTPGCGIISEFPLDSDSAAWHFPDRNRLIAALGDCLALIEARNQRSGSMITVGQALDQGKEVFAMPGRITDPMSLGCNELIRTGASPLLHPDDILDYLGLKCGPRQVPEKKILPNLSENHQKVYASLDGEPRSLDAILQRTGLRIGVIMELLIDLEREGAVQCTNGNSYSAVYR